MWDWLRRRSGKRQNDGDDGATNDQPAQQPAQPHITPEQPIPTQPTASDSVGAHIDDNALGQQPDELAQARAMARAILADDTLTSALTPVGQEALRGLWPSSQHKNNWSRASRP